MLRSSLCAFLAPALVSAMAFPWAGPEPTLIIPAGDNWSPAPTKGPEMGEMGLLELFKRQSIGDNTCGYINGISASSLTCNDNAYVCATNSYYGVHGCCDPSSIAECTIPTTCIPSSLMAVSCTDSVCSSNAYIAKCTDIDSPFCYQWRYVYSTRTVMTEFGCAASAFTVSVQRTFNGESIPPAATTNTGIGAASSIAFPSSGPTILAGSASSSASSSSSSSNGASVASQSQISTASSSAIPVSKSKTNVGAIVGGVIGGLIVIGAIIFGAIFLILRNKKNNAAAQPAAGGAPQQPMGPAPGVAEYKPQPQGYPPQQQYPPQNAQGGYYQQDVKPGFSQQPHMGVPGQETGGMSQPPYSPPMSPAPQYSAPLHQGPPAGVAEAGGTPISQPHQPPMQPNHQVYEAP
ncbi:hypothetical protein K432DRAFT_393088 [Lepidopterella palustris CBS 459.81]|uniref:Mid2 domain-containing protein n=1 Tax=Lepidopterella palustris CBS 459.81 TaxID=1314670 RepID=A0A8E2JF87_9PEZI|nr:hypothetical protein K432DRAFT_393088 [Lepidopterella palustris CBS 459.81]